MAQSSTTAGLVVPRTFKPLSMPGQHRPLTAPPAPLLSKKAVYYIILAALLVLFLGGAVFLCLKTSSIIARILIILAALVASAFSGFVLLTMAGLTATPDHSKQGIARQELAVLAQELGMSIDHVKVAIEDDECRIGLLIGELAIAVADFEDNKGLFAPYANLDTVLSMEGTRKDLPLLPSSNDEQWVIETKAAKQSNDTAKLYKIEWRFRNLSPKSIIVCYAQPDYFFQEAGSIERLIQHRLNESQGVLPAE